MKNKGLTHILVLSLLITSLTNCTEKMDIELDNDFERLVVEGLITDEEKIHTVELSKTTDFFNPGEAERISGAQIILSDGFKVDTLTENPDKAGTYMTPADYKGVPGREYKININLPEPIRGETQYEASDIMPPKRTMDSINVAYRVSWESWEVQAYAPDPPTTDFYRFDIYKNGELMTDTINEPFVTDDVLFNGQYTNGIRVGFLQVENPQEVVEIGDTITGKLSSISESYFTFMFDVIDETGFNNPLFDGPPANIRGNISNEGIGFFAATAVDYSTTTYEGEEIK